MAKVMPNLWDSIVARLKAVADIPPLEIRREWSTLCVDEHHYTSHGYIISTSTKDSSFKGKKE